MVFLCRGGGGGELAKLAEGFNDDADNIVDTSEQYF